MSDAGLSGLRGAVDLSSLVRPSSPSPSAPRAGGNGASADAGSAVVFETGDAGFQEVLELSARVPVIVEFYAAGIEPALGSLVSSYGGRLALATVDGNANPQLAQAFQVQQVPAVAAVIGGRPLQLFVGMPADDEVRQVLDQVLELAAQNGVTGTLTPDAEATDADVVEEPPLPPLHQEAFDAISRGDYAAAVAAYTTAITQDPRDTLAVAGRAQAALLLRLDGADAAVIREAAAAAPQDADAQLAVADLDLSGGHVDDAFGRLLDVFPALTGGDRDRVRERLLEFFEIVGADDPRVPAARRRLAMLLY
ncbi:putative thioredoxin [Diaminobutyricimonas aerilata]|uniref:Putative thioredoxin n=1 Tax=Diaminobutyricimonas aerilata TaxID=1162967 RepID=A0A2M9CIV4_9MICO|nr:tetratricopeptide repeat protein [Diaminobutyricimonas aerilata]PJJ71798.1 putative thioredoxin [Diaminobutyricimonas aerilata]